MVGAKPNFGPGKIREEDEQVTIIRRTVKRSPILWADLVTRLGLKRTDRVYVELEGGERLMLDISCKLYAEQIEEQDITYDEIDPEDC